MRLFLASEIKHPDSFAKLEVYIGGFNSKNIAYVPTASNGEISWNKWTEGETWKLFNKTSAKISTFLLEDYNNLDFPESLVNKDIIFMAGGMPGYLMYWIKRTKLDVYLHKLLEKKLIYVGSSAGAMIVSKTLQIAELEERGSSYLPGLEYVDFDFLPHYEDLMYEKIKEKYTGKKLFLVKNGEEIIVEKDNISVIGAERVIKG